MAATYPNVNQRNAEYQIELSMGVSIVDIGKEIDKLKVKTNCRHSSWDLPKAVERLLEAND
jgi:hypothetical protein